MGLSQFSQSKPLMSHGQPRSWWSGRPQVKKLPLPSYPHPVEPHLNPRLAGRRRKPGRCSVCFSIELRIEGSLQNWHLETASTQTPVLLDIATILALQITSLTLLFVFVFIPGSPQEAVKVWNYFLVTLPSSSLSLGRGTFAHTLLSFYRTSPRGSHLGSAFSWSHLTCSFFPAPSAELLSAP